VCRTGGGDHGATLQWSRGRGRSQLALIVNYTAPAFSVTDFTAVVAEERLSKAVVRLAFVLNNALQ
jgi:hypothetical protein